MAQAYGHKRTQPCGHHLATTARQREPRGDIEQALEVPTEPCRSPAASNWIIRQTENRPARSGAAACRDACFLPHHAKPASTVVGQSTRQLVNTKHAPSMPSLAARSMSVSAAQRTPDCASTGDRRLFFQRSPALRRARPNWHTPPRGNHLHDWLTTAYLWSTREFENLQTISPGRTSGGTSPTAVPSTRPAPAAPAH